MLLDTSGMFEIFFFSTGGLPSPALDALLALLLRRRSGFLDFPKLLTVDRSSVSEVGLSCRSHHCVRLGIKIDLALMLS